MHENRKQKQNRDEKKLNKPSTNLFLSPNPFISLFYPTPKLF